MLGWLSAISLRLKLTLVTILAITVTLVIAGAIMGAYDARTYESQKVGAITSEAEILAASLPAALTFSDYAAATEYLNATQANPEIVAAGVYDADGKLVASYRREGDRVWTVPETAGPRGARFEQGEIEAIVSVSDGTSTVGAVYLKANVEPVLARLARYAVIMLLVGGGALLVVLPISLWLHRLISNPIEELAARNAIIKTTLESVDHGVVVVDKDMRISFLNDRVVAIAGSTLPKLTAGMDFAAVVREVQGKLNLDESRRERDLSRLASTESFRDLYMLPDGRTIEYRQSPLASGGFVRTYTDVSEEKHLQEQLQQAKDKAEAAAQAKSQFLAAMSHEIRTPMSGVIGIVELLQATELNKDQKQMVELIQRSGLGLLDVINDILDYSKIEAGRMTVEQTEFSLGETIESTAEVIGGHTESKMLNISCSVDPQIDHTLRGDPVRVRQIILNLMGNAIKFTDKGTVAISAAVKSMTDSVCEVLIEVSDTGLGIPPDKQQHLFRAFSQADYSTTRKFGGTGLGLSICKNLVELMGGKIGARSVAGEGSTFWCLIPFGRLPEAARVDHFAVHRQSLSGLRALVCSPAALKCAAAGYLRAAGVDVIEVADVNAAVRRLEQDVGQAKPIDVAIINSGVADDGGARFAEQWNAHLSLKNIKAILVGQHSSGRTSHVAADKAYAGFLIAPFRAGRFCESVAAVIGRGARQEEKAVEASVKYTAPTVEEAFAGGALILVAEDNQTNQFVIRNQLSRLGFTAEFANDGREAWEAFSRDEKRYGMLISDCHMPFIDGYQLTGLIREREASRGGPRLPIVALTANALQGEAEICRAAGMDDYTSKPTNLLTLDAMIQKWLPAAGRLRRHAGDTSGAERPASAFQAKATAPPNTNDDGSPPIDLTYLASLLGTEDPDDLNMALTVYWETEAGAATKLHGLIDARDGKKLALAAHAAAGAAASVGAKRLAEACKAIEKNAKQDDWAAIGGLVPALDHAFNRTRQFIEQSERVA